MGVAWPREVTADGRSTMGLADRATKNARGNKTPSAMTTTTNFLTSQCSSREHVSLHGAGPGSGVITLKHHYPGPASLDVQDGTSCARLKVSLFYVSFPRHKPAPYQAILTLACASLGCRQPPCFRSTLPRERRPTPSCFAGLLSHIGI